MARRLWQVAAPIAAVCAAALAGGCTSSAAHASAGPAGRTTATLTPTALNGAPATPASLSIAAAILSKRFVGAGLPAPTVTVTSGGTLSLSVAAPVSQDELDSLVDLDLLTIRPMDASTPGITSSQKFADDRSAPGDPATLLAQARTAVGAAAYALAASLKTPPTDPAAIAELAPFGTLSPAEVAVLPPLMQYAVPAVGCAQLDARNPYYLAADRFTGAQVVACDSAQPPTKYLLDPAKMLGTDVATASATYDPVNYANSGGWVVSVTFTAPGQQKWAAFTDAETGSQVGIVVGDLVASAPEIETQIFGPAVITGADVTQQYAVEVADLLNAGALPAQFAVSGYASTS